MMLPELVKESHGFNRGSMSKVRSRSDSLSFRKAHYGMHFNGLFYIVDASGKIIALASNEYESGSWSWKVPLN